MSHPWVVLPVRSLATGHQRHKVREQVAALVLTGANLALTAAITTAQTDQEMWPRFLLSHGLGVTNRTELLVVFGLPSLAAHLLSSGLLLTYYKACHPWRALGQEREAACWGKLGLLGTQHRLAEACWETKVRAGILYTICRWTRLIVVIPREGM